MAEEYHDESYDDAVDYTKPEEDWEEKAENDSLSPEEEAFMKGYDEATESDDEDDKEDDKEDEDPVI
ncbi:hypothetical protein GOV05_01260 [Candidatus Woesearchaeota archaeon]|nr:hypothetical protein [Candidatus Woesearchaeota archaeon]